MVNHPRHLDRQSIRLPGYSYADPGAYFVTICTEGRVPLLGQVAHEAVIKSFAGTMVNTAWQALPSEFPHIGLDAFVIMPNHVHGILWIMPSAIPAEHRGDGDRPTGTVAGSLSRVVQAFKSRTTNQYIQGVRAASWPAFNRRLWQRNYFEHVIRSHRALQLIREYIVTNPQRWNDDAENLLGSRRDDYKAWAAHLVEPETGRRQASPLQKDGHP